MSDLHPEDQAKLQYVWDFVRGFGGDNVVSTGASVWVGSGSASKAVGAENWRPQQYRVVSEENDYLICNPYNSQKALVGSREVEVAKPMDFRGDTERWGVYPPYVADVSVLWAAPLLNNGATDADDNAIVLMDLNLDGRSASGFYGLVGAASDDTTNVWTYAITEQVPVAGGYADLNGGRSLTGIRNSIEDNNSGSGVQGNSIDLDGQVFTDNSGLEIQPIEGAPVVWVRRYQVDANTYEYRVEYVNAIDGECG